MKSTIFDNPSKNKMNRWIALTLDCDNSQKTCEFSHIDKEIKEHLILPCTSSSLLRRALWENLSLEALLKLGRTLDLSEKQAKQVKKTESDIHRFKTTENDRRSRPRSKNSSQSCHDQSLSRNRHTKKLNRVPERCANCGGYAPHRNPFPARGKSCWAFGKIGSLCTCLQIKTSNCSLCTTYPRVR